jgi:DinB superfamily
MKNYADQYKAATDEFLKVVDSLKPSDLDKSDSEGWNPRQVIHHMADSETQSYARLRKLIAEPGTTIQGYDEGKWAENETLGYRTEGVEDSIAVIKAVRQSTYELIKRLSEAQLDNTVVHTESGEFSVRKWLEVYSKHPSDHANQIREQINS